MTLPVGQIDVRLQKKTPRSARFSRSFCTGTCVGMFNRYILFKSIFLNSCYFLFSSEFLNGVLITVRIKFNPLTPDNYYT